jgi:hypothetical protein
VDAQPMIGNDKLSDDEECAMLAYVRAIYQRAIQLSRKTTSARRLIALDVVRLEDRCTPARVAGLFPLLHPPENAVPVQIAFAPVLLGGEPAFMPTFTGIGAAAETPLVRTDLFGSGNTEAPSDIEDDNDFALAEFSPTHESAFEFRVRHQPETEMTPTTKELDQTSDARKHETAEQDVPCVMLEYDAAVEAE